MLSKTQLMIHIQKIHESKVTYLLEWLEEVEKIENTALPACWIKVMLVVCVLNSAEYGSFSLFYSSVTA